MKDDLSATGSTIVHAVHGTWPYGWHKRCPESDPPWFVESSTFAQYILQKCQARWLAFAWSGKNSFAARNAATELLVEHLRESMKTPGTRHILVAHSHGGTVAAAALAKLNTAERSRIEGLITMGAPFITLTHCDFRLLNHIRYLTSRFALPIAAIYAACVLCASWLQIPNIFVEGLIFVALAEVVLFLMLKDSSLFGRLYGSAYSKVTEYVGLFDHVGRLKRPIVALRAPADEAGFAISTAQFVNYLSGRIWLSLVRDLPVSLYRYCTNRSLLWRVAAWTLVMSVVAGTTYAFAAHIGTELFGPSLKGVAVDLAFSVAVGSIIAASSLLFLASMSPLLTALILFPATVMLCFATGIEAWKFAGVTEVECEPVPSGMRAVVETLHLTHAETSQIERRGSLRHSFHELPAARRRTAELVRIWTSKEAELIADLGEGGRARELIFELWEQIHGAALQAGGDQASDAFTQLLAKIEAAQNAECESAFEEKFLPLLHSSQQLQALAKISSVRAERTRREIAEMRRDIGEMGKA
jgi:pimeloyl-ACP methyl ester carboxylesterase